MKGCSPASSCTDVFCELQSQITWDEVAVQHCNDPDKFCRDSVMPQDQLVDAVKRRSMKCSGVFHSLLCSRIWRRVKMWSQDRPGQTYLLWSEVLLKDSLDTQSCWRQWGKEVLCPSNCCNLQDLPFWATKMQSSTLQGSGLLPKSAWRSQSEWEPSHSAFNISAVTPSAPGALPLFIALLLLLLPGSVDQCRYHCCQLDVC